MSEVIEFAKKGGKGWGQKKKRRGEMARFFQTILAADPARASSFSRRCKYNFPCSRESLRSIYYNHASPRQPYEQLHFTLHSCVSQPSAPRARFSHRTLSTARRRRYRPRWSVSTLAVLFARRRLPRKRIFSLTGERRHAPTLQSVNLTGEVSETKVYDYREGASRLARCAAGRRSSDKSRI